MAEQLAKKVNYFKVPSSELPSLNKSVPDNISNNKESQDNDSNNEFTEATNSKTDEEEKIESWNSSRRLYTGNYF